MAFAHQVRPDGEGFPIASAGAFAVVISQREEQGRGGAELAEIEALRKVLLGGGFARGVLLGHERVAQVDVEIRFVGKRVGERLLVNGGIGVPVQMGIRRDRESERAVRRARGMESAGGAARELRRAGRARTELIVILGVGLQPAEDHLSRFAFLELSHRRLHGVGSRLRAESHKAFHVLIRQHAQGDRVLLRAGQDQVKRMDGNGEVESVWLRRAPVSPAFGGRSLLRQRVKPGQQEDGKKQVSCLTHGRLLVG